MPIMWKIMGKQLLVIAEKRNNNETINNHTRV
jgi:hypothetical protein